MLYRSPTGITITGRDQIERQAMKMVLILQFLIEITQQGIIKVNNGPAAAAGSKDQAYGTISTRKNSGGVTLIDSEKLLLLAVTSGPIDVNEFPVGTFEC